LISLYPEDCLILLHRNAAVAFGNMKVQGIKIPTRTRVYWYFHARRLRKHYSQEWDLGVLRAFHVWADAETRKVWLDRKPEEIKWYGIQELILKRDARLREYKEMAETKAQRDLRDVVKSSSFQKWVEREDAESLGFLDTIVKLRTGAITTPETAKEFWERVKRDGGYRTKDGKWIPYQEQSEEKSDGEGDYV